MCNYANIELIFRGDEIKLKRFAKDMIDCNFDLTNYLEEQQNEDLDLSELSNMVAACKKFLEEPQVELQVMMIYKWDCPDTLFHEVAKKAELNLEIRVEEGGLDVYKRIIIDYDTDDYYCEDMERFTFYEEVYGLEGRDLAREMIDTLPDYETLIYLAESEEEKELRESIAREYIDIDKWELK